MIDPVVGNNDGWIWWLINGGNHDGHDETYICRSGGIMIDPAVEIIIDRSYV